jgi:exodeoxyribonuclease X
VTIVETPFVLLDTETTDREPEKAELLEVAARLLDGELALVREFSSLVRPTQPIPPAASAIHHIVDADVEDAPERAVVEDQLLAFLPASAVIVAHNAPYDRAIVGERFAAFPWLCTQRLAQHLAPEAPEYKNATLYYWMGGPKVTGALHRAGGDLDVTWFNLARLLDRYRAFAVEQCAGDPERLAKSEQIETLLEFVNRPYVMTKFPNFGKHKGVAMDQIPLDYFEWCLSPRGLTDCDEDLRWNIRRQMRFRAGVAA